MQLLCSLQERLQAAVQAGVIEVACMSSSGQWERAWERQWSIGVRTGTAVCTARGPYVLFKGSGPLGVQVLAVDRGAKPHARAPAAPLARVAALGRVPAAVKSWGHGQEHERPRGQLSAAPQ